MKDVELLEYMIVNAVNKGVEQALEKHLKPLKEELAKVKALNAKLLKEQISLKESLMEGLVTAPVVQPLALKQIKSPSGIPQHLQEASKAAELSVLKQQAAPFVKADGHLPDVNIDPGLFLKRK